MNRIVFRAVVGRFAGRVGLGLLLALGSSGLAADAPKPAAKPAAFDYVRQLAAKLKPTRTVVYKTVGDRELRLHLFEPTGHAASDRRACFLGIHGGGWGGGDATRFYPYAAHFAEQGLLGASLEYRLIDKQAKTTPFDCVKDGRSAVRYLRRHAAELGIDPNKIVVGGGSAGGHVAAGTGMFDGMDDPQDDVGLAPAPAALVLLYPVIDTSTAGYGNAKCGPGWRDISPLHRVKSGLPPTLVLHGTGDTVTPFAGALAFHESMQKAGNRCELIRHEGGRHGYFIFEQKLYEQAIGQIDAFLTSLKLRP